MIEEPAMMTESKQAETGQMKAIVRERFGSPDVLQLTDSLLNLSRLDIVERLA